MEARGRRPRGQTSEWAAGGRGEGAKRTSGQGGGRSVAAVAHDTPDERGGGGARLSEAAVMTDLAEGGRTWGPSRPLWLPCDYVSGRDLAHGGHVYGTGGSMHGVRKKKKKRKTQKIRRRRDILVREHTAPPSRGSGIPHSSANASVRPITGRCAPPPHPCPCSRRGRAAGRRGSPASRRRFGSTPPARGVGQRRSLRSRCTNCSCCWTTPVG